MFFLACDIRYTRRYAAPIYKKFLYDSLYEYAVSVYESSVAFGFLLI